eukprot:Protomagalhaensia_sp_Gyna_25__1701@NODE_188_length_4554_cov_22_246733_g146_i0_p1_GENE_NODE_188_length_4554_cov_22_246733_g146_i0NODE_188_length_4554_cov_22_246733_g146_i0_p1_ORF_typecomplete_len467_score97_53CwfJ_C_1/PF04677_15/6_2e13CwfJ_C_2/PF04676_14/0_034_NODE_188_length_4554_cov_22_246733_g146_i07072107
MRRASNSVSIFVPLFSMDNRFCHQSTKGSPPTLDPLDAFLQQTSHARPTPQKRKQEALQIENLKTKTYLAQRELNPQIRDQLLREINQEPIKRNRTNQQTSLQESKYQQSDSIRQLVNDERTSKGPSNRDFLRKLALEREDPMAQFLSQTNEPSSLSEEPRKKPHQEEERSSKRNRSERDVVKNQLLMAKKQDTKIASLTSRCAFCIDSELCQRIRKSLFVANSDLIYLASMSQRDLLVPFHSTLCPLEHVPNSVVLDDETLTDIRDFKKAIRQFFKDPDLEKLMESIGYSKGPYKPLFIEWNIPSKKQEDWMQTSQQHMGVGSHFSIDVIPLNEDDFEEAKMITAQEFRSLGGSVNRQNRAYQELKPSPRRGPKDVVPTGTIPYIYVDFGMSQALVHTLEEDTLRGNLRDRVDRKFMRDLIRSFYPADTLRPDRLEWDEYVSTYKQIFRRYDWTLESSAQLSTKP